VGRSGGDRLAARLPREPGSLSRHRRVERLSWTVAPIARTASGLPVSVQIIGGYLEDRTPISFSGLVEREFGGLTPPPNL